MLFAYVFCCSFLEESWCFQSRNIYWVQIEKSVLQLFIIFMHHSKETSIQLLILNDRIIIDYFSSKRMKVEHVLMCFSEWEYCGGNVFHKMFDIQM